MRTEAYETVWQEDLCSKLTVNLFENGYESLLEMANFSEKNNDKTTCLSHWCQVYTQSMAQLFPQSASWHEQRAVSWPELQRVYWEMCHQIAI